MVWWGLYGIIFKVFCGGEISDRLCVLLFAAISAFSRFGGIIPRKIFRDESSDRLGVGFLAAVSELSCGELSCGWGRGEIIILGSGTCDFSSSETSLGGG